MATTTRVLTASVNGSVYTTNANDALEAIDTCHSGATAPTDEVANGKLWLDTTTTPGILKIYNNATWEVVLTATGTSQVKLNGIEALADVTDATNVTAAGALMDSELTAIASVKALNQGVATTDTPTFSSVTADTFIAEGSFDFDAGGTIGASDAIPMLTGKVWAQSAGIQTSGNTAAVYMTDTTPLGTAGGVVIASRNADTDTYSNGYLSLGQGLCSLGHNSDFKFYYSPGGTTAPTVSTMTISTAGTVTANAFAGDGSALTGIYGQGQTLQDMSASRVSGTSYRNTTGSTIFVGIEKRGGGGSFQYSTDNATWVTVAGFPSATGSYEEYYVGLPIPNNVYYRISSGGFEVWTELR